MQINIIKSEYPVINKEKFENRKTGKKIIINLINCNQIEINLNQLESIGKDTKNRT